jgi:hypothetical protein
MSILSVCGGKTEGAHRKSPGEPGLSQWRWRELNPRPMQCSQGFSGRSLRRFSQLQPACKQVAAELSCIRVPLVPATKTKSIGPLNDASIRVESVPGLTDWLCYLGSESEVVLCFRFSIYFFTESVYEITLCPRPASPVATNIVETCHPHMQLSISVINQLCRSTLLFRIAPDYLF